MREFQGFLYLPCVVAFFLALPLLSVLAHKHDNFFQCLNYQLRNSINATDDELIYTPNDLSYFSLLNFSMQNQRFNAPFYRKPHAIITPTKVSHVQAAVYCSKKHGYEIRTRSGGHDFEGLSYVSYNHVRPFIVIDLIKYRSISVDLHARTASVQAGATIGEVAYQIAEKSDNLGFPAGLCHTVGVGGHFSGGGWGSLSRKYGLSADNIIDAELVDAEGRILDRKSMGEDLFWAIRGGGAANFGVIISWKLWLVRVPSTVTVLSVIKVFGAKETAILLHRWQQVAHRYEEDLFFLLTIRTTNASTPQGNNKKMVQVSADALFLGRADELIELVRTSFPELRLERDDCSEMRWIDSVLYFAGFTDGQSPVALANRTPQIPGVRLPYKGKHDFVTKPIPEEALETLVRRLYEVDVGMAFYQFVPHGGKMSEIPDSAIPYPHRRGNLYHVLYIAYWEKDENVPGPQRQVSWVRSVYNFMARYVSMNPRSAYINYRDLDIGNGSTSYAEASIWGIKYFKSNFKRLVEVKTMVDPSNFFRNEQSIPAITEIG